MLSRAATKITLTPDDVAMYERRKSARDATKQEDTHSSQDSNRSTVEDAIEMPEENTTPAAQTRAARVKMSREQRIGVGSSRA